MESIDSISFFPGDSSDSRTRLEGTTHLLYQREMPELLRDLDAKVVFILRDPADRIRSSFQYTQNNLGNVVGKLTFADYAEMLLQGDQRKLAAHFRPSASRWVLCRELSLSRYSQHVERWNAALGKRRVHLVNFESIQVKPDGFYSNLVLLAIN